MLWGVGGRGEFSVLWVVMMEPSLPGFFVPVVVVVVDVVVFLALKRGRDLDISSSL